MLILAKTRGLRETKVLTTMHKIMMVRFPVKNAKRGVISHNVSGCLMFLLFLHGRLTTLRHIPEVTYTLRTKVPVDTLRVVES